MSSWEKFTRKYVWDEQKTPFFTPVAKLNKSQANSEVFLFVVFVATPFTLILLAAMAYVVRGAAYEYLVLAFYAATVLGAVLLLNAVKHWPSALYCLTAPASLLLYFLFNGFSERMQVLDELLVVGALVGWLCYTVRIVSIARAYPDMPAGPPDRPRRRR